MNFKYNINIFGIIIGKKYININLYFIKMKKT